MTVSLKPLRYPVARAIVHLVLTIVLIVCWAESEKVFIILLSSAVAGLVTDNAIDRIRES